jgi:hypothetical protein
LGITNGLIAQKSYNRRSKPEGPNISSIPLQGFKPRGIEVGKFASTSTAVKRSTQPSAELVPAA